MEEHSQGPPREYRDIARKGLPPCSNSVAVPLYEREGKHGRRLREDLRFAL